MEKYISPFSITNKMLELTSSIMEKVGKLANFSNLNKMPILRRNNRIHSIHSSLAIEANSLSFSQVKDVINGKLVFGDKKEIQEVKNAYKAYEIMDKLGLKSKDSFRDNYLNPALDNGLIKMTQPDKPTSKNQMYYKD